MAQQRKIDAIRKKVMEALDIPYDIANDKAKREELDNYKSLHKDKYYRDKIFETKEDSKCIENMKIALEFAETPEQHDLWDTFRARTSSIVGRKNIGRNIRILVKDETTKTYVGIISLASDFADYQARDDFIGWSSADRFESKKLNYVMNINTCVGLQPVAFNCNIGKLLVAICYSTEVHDYIFQKYGHHIACITTMSINGKSIQYDRMKPYLQLVGYTKGVGTTQISDTLYKQCVTLLKSINDVAFISRMLKRPSRFNVLLKAFDVLGIDKSKLKHGQPRGCYVGFVGSNCKEFLCGQADIFGQENVKPLKDIVDWWKKRWALPRFNHLKSTGGLVYVKKFLNYKDIYNVEKQRKYITKMKAELGNQQYHNNQSSYARNYRKQIKEERDTEIVKICNENLKDLEAIDAKVLAGFVDGDGSIYVNRSKAILNVCVQQCNPEILLKLYKQFGGNIREKKPAENSKSSLAYSWCISGTAIIPYLEYILPYLIIDCEKAKLALDWLKTDDQMLRTEIGSKILLLDKNTNAVKDYSNIDYRYIAGMLDAEGCVGFTTKGEGDKRNVNRSLTITQKCDIRLLNAIRDFVGFGKVTTARFILYSGDEIVRFIDQVEKYITVKKVECELAKKEIASSDKEEKFALVKQIIEYKHKTHNIEDITKVKIVNNPMNVALKVIPQHQREINRERMTGEKNPNKNGMSEEHRQRMAYSIAMKKIEKRKYSDEQILRVRNRFKEGGISQTKLAEEEGIPRCIVSCIVLGKLRTTDEVKESPGTIVKSRYNKAEPKVKWCVADVITVLSYFKEHPNMLFAELCEKGPELIGRELKLTTVRNWIYGKVGPKEAEFPINGVTYEQYKTMIRATK